MITILDSFFKNRPIVLLLFSLLFLGCEPDNQISDTKYNNSENIASEKRSDLEQTFYGPAQHMGNGVVRTSVTMTQEGRPLQVAIVLSEKALNSLSDTGFNLSLPLHNRASNLSIDHIDVGWNPMGHEPDFLYAIPHFDIHFYWISNQEQMAINDSDLAEIIPSSEYIPMTYFDTPGFVPNMGKHWLSGLADELVPGNVFNKTFIYGSYNGSFIFEEAMITREYLLQKNFQESIPIYQPEQYEVPGYYPTSYSIKFDDVKKSYTVSLDGFVWND